MRLHDIFYQILPILTVITFALAAPVLVQEERQACADEPHVPRDVISVLRKRTVGDDLHMLWDGPWHLGTWVETEEHVPEVHTPPSDLAGEPAVPEVHAPPNLGRVHVAGVHAPPSSPEGVRVPVHALHMPWDFWNLRLPEAQVPEVHVPPPGLAEGPVPEVHHALPPNLAGVHVVGVHAPPPSPEGVRVPAHALHIPWDFWNMRLPEAQEPEVHVPPHSPEDSDRESMELGDDAPPMSPGSSAESESESTSTRDRWSTITNAPSVESQSDNLKAADDELIRLMKGKAKISRRISGTPGCVDMVNAAQMELRSAVDPRTQINIPPPL